MTWIIAVSADMKKIEIFMVIGLLLLGVPCLGQDVAGIGVVLNKEKDGIVVKQVLPGAPAAISNKIKANDRILAIGQGDKASVNIEGKNLSEIVQMIRGPKGTVVRVTILPDGKENAQPEVISLVRGEIKEIAAAPPSEENRVGEMAPEIAGEDLDGKKFKLSDYRGKVVLIDFWGDW